MAADTDAQTDVYDRSGGTTTLLSTGPAGGNGALPAAFEGTLGRRHPCLLQHQRGSDGGRHRRAPGHIPAGRAPRPSSCPRARLAATARSTSISWARRWTASNVYVRTEESLVAADTDTGCAAGQGPQCRDVYEYAGGITTLVSTGPAGRQRGLRCLVRGRVAGREARLLRHARADDERRHRRLGRRLRAVRRYHDAPVHGPHGRQRSIHRIPVHRTACPTTARAPSSTRASR